MQLGSPLEKSGNRGDAHAGADVARQINDARAHVGFFARDVGERRHVDRDEEECQPEGLQHAPEHGMFEIKPTSYRTANSRMNTRSNQSSRWPLSRMICRLPRPRLMRPRPM